MRHGDRCPRAVVDFPAVVVFWLTAIILVTVIPGRTVAPDYASCFLETPVRVNELGAYQAGIGSLSENVDQLVEPVWEYPGIVVEEHQEFATRFLGGTIARMQKAEVDFIPQVANCSDAGKQLRRVV